MKQSHMKQWNVYVTKSIITILKWQWNVYITKSVTTVIMKLWNVYITKSVTTLAMKQWNVYITKPIITILKWQWNVYITKIVTTMKQWTLLHKLHTLRDSGLTRHSKAIVDVFHGCIAWYQLPTVRDKIIVLDPIKVPKKTPKMT